MAVEKTIHTYFRHITFLMSHVTSLNYTQGWPYELPHGWRRFLQIDLEKKTFSFKDISKVILIIIRILHIKPILDGKAKEKLLEQIRLNITSSLSISNKDWDQHGHLFLQLQPPLFQISSQIIRIIFHHVCRHCCLYSIWF